MVNNILVAIKIVQETQLRVISAIRKAIFQEIVRVKTNEEEPKEIKVATIVTRKVIFLVNVPSLKKKKVREDKMQTTTLSVSNATKWVMFHVNVPTLIKMINKIVVETTNGNEEMMVVHSDALQKVVLHGAMMKVVPIINKITGVIKSNTSKTLKINLMVDGVRPQVDEKSRLYFRETHNYLN